MLFFNKSDSVENEVHSKNKGEALPTQKSNHSRYDDGGILKSLL